MHTSFKRVISHPDELGNLSKKTSMEVDAKELATEDAKEFATDCEDDRKKPASTTAAATPPAVVEVDDPMENEPLVHVRFQASSNGSYSSSLSGSSTGLFIDFHEELVTDDPRRNEAHMHRVDSTKSVDSAKGSGSGTWGWFQDVHGAEKNNSFQKKVPSRMIDIAHPSVDNEAAAAYRTMAPPTDVLEESRSTQDLFKRTAGNRPPQPEEDRAYFEMLWRQNFAMSKVDYQVPKEILTAGTPISSSAFADSHFSGDSRELSNYGNLAIDSMATDAEVAEAIERLHGGREGPQRTPHEVVNRQVRGTGGNKDLTVLIRGDNVFGTTVSKSFDRVNRIGNREVDTVNISIASYRVVESKKDGKYAQFLVIYREGSIRDTIGVWKRYSDFEALSNKVTQSHDNCTSVLANISPLAITEEQDVENLPNAITSWHLLKKRKRWYRCLDAGYLSLKVFLLERFLHDILFESSRPNLLRDFVIYDNSK